MEWYNTLIKDEDGNINGILSSGEDITERKRAEKELIESEEKFRGLFDNITVGFAYHKIILNNDGIPVDYEYIDINSMFTQLTGIIREKAIGKRVTEIFPGIENDPADWIGKYGKVALERLHLSFENYSEPLKKWYLVNAYSPKKGYFVTIFIDISERKKTDEKLRESEEKFRMLSEQSLMAVLIIQDDVAKYANEAYSKIIEYPIDEILTWEANKIFQTVHPEDRKLVKEQARKKQIGIENGVITHYTYRIISRTGKVKWVENYSKTLQYGDKSADFITLIDITETIIAERAKQESENRYQNLVETMNEGLAIIDINNKITYVNPKLIRMVGFSREDLIDKTIFDFFGEKDKMIISNQLSKHKKDFPGIFEMEWHKKDGSTLYTMISTQQILDEQGNNSGSSAVITDITDLKKNEQELENRTESLEKALKEKESLMRELHHRVKNNLQIISAITVLHEATVDEKTAVIFKEYQNRIKAMAKIHETLYRSEDIENIDMEGYVLNLIQNLILSYNVDPEKIKIIPKIDNFDLNISKAMHYGLIINELISNALKHAFPKNGKGRISVSILKGEGDLITLIVEDDGIGLPSEIDFTNPSTMGLKIIKTSTNQLKGKIYLTKDNGTKWEIIFKEG
jgi:PAS domain S-box-containing protein